MLKDALEFLTNIGRSSANYQEIDDPTNNKSWFVNGTGSMYEIEHENNIAARADCPQSFVESAMHYSEEGSLAVWVGQHKVIGVLDDNNYRRNTISMPLNRTKEFDFIESFTEATYKPREAIKFLSRNFSGSEVEQAVKALRKVDFHRQEQTKSHREKAGESLGKSVERQVQSVDQIPDVIKVNVPVLDMEGFRESKSLFLYCEVDFDCEGFEFFFKPSDVTALQYAALRDVYNYLKDKLDCEVFFGSPRE